MLSLQTLRCCRLGQILRKNWLNFKKMVFARDVYSEKWLSKFLVYNVQLVQKIATLAIQALLLLSSPRLSFLVLVEIKSELSKNTRK